MDVKIQIKYIDTDMIFLNPRANKSINPQKIKRLSTSIKKFGLLQPLVVQKIDISFEEKQKHICKSPESAPTRQAQENALKSVFEDLNLAIESGFEEKEGFSASKSRLSCVFGANSAQINPPCNSFYQIVSGTHRLYALRALGAKQVPCVILKNNVSRETLSLGV